MSFSKELSKTLEKEYKGVKDEDYNYKSLYKEKILSFRKQKNVVERIERPSNLLRAKSLGYKAKQGIILARVKVRKGSGSHQRPSRGRRPKRMGVKKLTRRISIQSIAEQRASRKFPNLEALNSYWVGEDGRQKFFEVILVDKEHPSVKADKKLSWISEKQHRRRVFRGLTSTAKKTRGLKKGFGYEKHFPSQRSHDRKAK